MFEGFARTEIQTSGARIVAVHGGKGPPVLLMHGNPFTHVSWHKVAPRLAAEFTVVCTDLRGYGDSEKPPGGDDHSGYSFRAMAKDQVEVMCALGHGHFFDAAAMAEYIRCFKNPATIHAMCEDYRATFTIDLETDTRDVAAGRKIACPVLLLWGATGGVGRNHEPMEIWRDYAADIRSGKALSCGHYLSEEAPDQTYAELRAFLTAKV